MARKSTNTKSSRSNYGDSSQLNNWILDSGATCNMTPDISNFILGLLAETDKYIEVVDGHFIAAEKIVEVRIKMRDDNGKTFIATLYNMLLEPDLCD